MKLNHRLLITSGLLLAMSTVAMSTATYAWFTTTRVARFSTATVGIKADSNLEYRVLSVNGNSIDYRADTLVGKGIDRSVATLLETKQGWTSDALPDGIIPGDTLVDVSGNGANFFKPTMGAGPNYYTNIKSLNTNGEYKSGYFMTLQVEFRSSAEFKVYLGSGTALTDTVSDGGSVTSLAKAARIAYFDYGFSIDSEVPSLTLTGGDSAATSTKASGTYSCVYVQDTDEPKFIPQAYNEGGAFETIQQAEQTINGTVTYNYFPNGTVQKTTPSAITSTDEGANTKLVTTLVKASDNEVYQDNDGNSNILHKSVVDVRIWVEGSDKDCIDSAKKNSFKATLDFQAYLG